nr:MAG TPA: hypothetical protein [Caudoviricetes sp.]
MSSLILLYILFGCKKYRKECLKNQKNILTE